MNEYKKITILGNEYVMYTYTINNDVIRQGVVVPGMVGTLEKNCYSDTFKFVLGVDEPGLYAFSGEDLILLAKLIEELNKMSFGVS